MKDGFSSDESLGISAYGNKRIAKVRDYVRCDHCASAHRGCGYVATKPMQVEGGDSSAGRIVRLLSNERCDHPCQYVAGPASSHPGVTRSTHIDLTIGRGDEGWTALEHQNHFAVHHEGARYVDRMFENLSNGFRDDSRHRAWMR